MSEYIYIYICIHHIICYKLSIARVASRRVMSRGGDPPGARRRGDLACLAIKLIYGYVYIYIYIYIYMYTSLYIYIYVLLTYNILHTINLCYVIYSAAMCLCCRCRCRRCCCCCCRRRRRRCLF